VLKKVVKVRKVTEPPAKVVGPKRVPGELLKDERWEIWPFGFKVLGAMRGKMALTSGYLFAVRLARIHHARASMSSDDNLAITTNFGEDLGCVFLEKFEEDISKGRPPWRSEEFLKAFTEALKDLAAINGSNGIPTDVGRAWIFKKYHRLRSGCLLPPMEKQIRDPATSADAGHINRSLKKFGLHLLNGHKVVSLRKALRGRTHGEVVTSPAQRSTVLSFIHSPLDWPLADLVEAILWRTAPEDILQPTILNFRQISKRILDIAGGTGSHRIWRVFTDFFRDLYHAAFDSSHPQVEFSDICGPIPVHCRKQTQMSYKEMKTSGGLSEFTQFFLRTFEERVEACFFEEIRAVLDGGGQRREQHQTKSGPKNIRKFGSVFEDPSGQSDLFSEQSD